MASEGAVVPAEDAYLRSADAAPPATTEEEVELAALKQQMGKLKDRQGERHKVLEVQWQKFEEQDEYYRTLEARQAEMDTWSQELIMKVKAETQKRIAAELEEKKRQEMALLQMPEKSEEAARTEIARREEKVMRLRETEPRRDLRLHDGTLAIEGKA